MFLPEPLEDVSRSAALCCERTVLKSYKTLRDKHLRPLSFCHKWMLITVKSGCCSCGSPLSPVLCVFSCFYVSLYRCIHVLWVCRMGLVPVFLCTPLFCCSLSSIVLCVTFLVPRLQRNCVCRLGTSRVCACLLVTRQTEASSP